jgi:hypothetical protein
LVKRVKLLDLEKEYFCFLFSSKNGGTCILLENNHGRKDKNNLFIENLLKNFLAQCLCTPVFRGITCNQFSYVPCGDATCHGTQVKKKKRRN